MKKRDSGFHNRGFDFSYSYTEHKSHDRAPHGHDFYEFILILMDNSTLSVNGIEQCLRANMLVFIRPQDEYYFSFPVDSAEPNFLHMVFDAEFADSLFQYLGEAGNNLKERLWEKQKVPVCALTEREKSRITEKIQLLESPDSNEDYIKTVYIRFLIAELFSLFMQKSIQLDKEENIPLWLDKTCEKMHKHENFSEGISRMVELSGKTREHLARCMQKYKNITVSEFVNNLRLEYVADMLISSNMSIVDLCYESGFSSLDYFGKQFKKKYGVTPSKFRLQRHNETI